MISWAYLRGVEAAPLDPAGESLTADESAEAVGVHPKLLDELWRTSNVSVWGLERSEFERIVLLVGMAHNFGLPLGSSATTEQQAAFYRELKLEDLVLAKACAAGDERAWEHFVARYSQPLTRAAIAISGSETVGRDMADGLYAELFGLSERGGARRCPLDSYRGRGSLLGWLRTTLAQRFVDHHRRTFREEPLAEFDAPGPDCGPEATISLGPMLAQAVEEALQCVDVEDRFLLAAYFLDDRTLAQIAAVLRVHEATVSRRLRRAAESVRKEVVRDLMKAGMSRRAADEALGTDPRDVDLKMDLKKVLQGPKPKTFPGKEPPNQRASKGIFSNGKTSDKAKAAE
jgi:RNA polymerase sigma-70 factor, ECF subfamily